MALAGILVTSVDACAEVVRESEGGLSGFVKEFMGWFGENDQAEADDRLLRELQGYDSLSGQDKASVQAQVERLDPCLLYTSPSPRDGLLSRMPSSA